MLPISNTAAPVCSQFCGDRSSSAGICLSRSDASIRCRCRAKFSHWQERSGQRLRFLYYRLLLLGIGHLVGLSVGIAMLIGALIGWGWGVPHFSAMAGDLTTAAATLAQKTWSTKSDSSAPVRSAFLRFGRLLKLGKARDQWSGRRDGCVSRA